MTIEIRELVIEVQVSEPASQVPSLSAAGYTPWDEQRLLEWLKQEVVNYLLERGSL